MHRALVTAIVLLVLCTTSPAQQRSPNAGIQNILRTWPAAGSWQTALIRLFDGAFGCWLVTGYAGSEYRRALRLGHKVAHG